MERYLILLTIVLTLVTSIVVMLTKITEYQAAKEKRKSEASNAPASNPASQPIQKRGSVWFLVAGLVSQGLAFVLFIGFMVWCFSGMLGDRAGAEITVSDLRATAAIAVMTLVVYIQANTLATS